MKKNVGPHAISGIARLIVKKVGKYKNYKIVDHYNQYITGSTNITSYNYRLKVTYDKGVIDEILGFKKDKGPEAGLYLYRANSDLLMQ